MADRLYDYTNSREGVHQGQLFSGNRNTKLSAEDLRKEFEADSNVQLRNAFGSFDNYLAYMDERQDLIDSGGLKADWWDTGDPLFDPETGYEVINEGDPNVDYKEQMMTLSAGGYNSQAAMHDLYTKYTGQDITEAQTNEQGDAYRWNGTSYVKTFTNDGGFAKDLTIGLMTAAIGAAASPLLASKLGATGLGAGVSKGVAAGTINAGTQLALTGDIDPKSVLASGLVAGLNPGKILAGGVGDALGMSATDQPFNPDSFGYGAISGAGNAAVSQAITQGKLDGSGILQAGLLSGAANSIRDAIYDSEYYSREAIAERLIQQGYTPEDAWYKAGNDPNLFKGKSDLGALVGEGGLFNFVPEVPVGPVAGLLDAISGGTRTFYRYPDEDQTEIPAYLMNDDAITRAYNAGAVEVEQNRIGLLNNPVINTAGKVLGQVLGTPTMSEKDKAIYDSYRELAEAEAEDAVGKEGWKNLDGVSKEALITQNQQELYRGYLASYHGSDGLDEKYTVAPNPRGDADIIGSALVGIDPETNEPLYTTGIRYDDQLADGANITTALQIPNLPTPSTSNNIIVNLADNNQTTLPTGANGQDFLNYLLTDSIINGTFASDDTTSNEEVVETEVSTEVESGGNEDIANTETPNTNNTDTNSTPANPVTEEVADGGGATAPEAETTPIYNLPINDDGTATLPGGATVPANVADDIYGQTYLPPSYELAGGGNETLPGGGTLPSGGKIKPKGGDGLPPLWTELFGYTKISPYQKARLKVLDGMLSGMAGGAVGNMNALSFGANRDPYQKIGKSLIDAGMEPRG